MSSYRLSDQWLLKHSAAVPAGEYRTGRKSLTSLDTEDSTALWKIAQSDQKEACMAFFLSLQM